MSTFPSDLDPLLDPLLAVGAHPDDIEFGAGGIIAAESARGRPVHLVVGSRGEAGTNGTPEQREQEAREAAVQAGASLEFLALGGDANIEPTRAGTRIIAAVIRQMRPGIVLAPTTAENQHPDHVAIGRMTRDATRLARYGGLAELQELDRHSIRQLFHYPIGAEAIPSDRQPILYPLNEAAVAKWTAMMDCHASQMKTRSYRDMQLTRAAALGLRAGVAFALDLYPNDPVVIGSLAQLGGRDRHDRS